MSSIGRKQFPFHHVALIVGVNIENWNSIGDTTVRILFCVHANNLDIDISVRLAIQK